jgi:hypothetical protein
VNEVDNGAQDIDTRQQTTVFESTDGFDMLDYFDDLLQPRSEEGSTSAREHTRS